MALYQRENTWWTHFFVDGMRFRKSLKTSNREVAARRETRLIARAENGAVGPTSSRPGLRLLEAIDEYLQDRKLEASENTLRLETDRAKRLREGLGNVKLVALTGRVIRLYQGNRHDQGVSNRTINMEIGLLRRVLKKAKRWKFIAEDVKMLHERNGVGRALTEDEKRVLLSVNVTDPEHAPYWDNLLCAVKLALATTMRGCELRGLRWKDVDLFGRTLTVCKSKTEAGERVIPLNTDALTALSGLRGRAEQMGEVNPEHYVFPACESFKVDPTRPQKSWRTAWRTLTRSIGLKGLRFHDLRHTAITNMLEKRVPDFTVMEIAGHVSRRMLQTYSHIRLEARRKAVEAISSTASETSPAAMPLLPGQTAQPEAQIQ